jgi:transcriptional regulator GlxA family with amidase domain
MAIRCIVAGFYAILAFLPLTLARNIAHHGVMRTEILIYDGFDELDGLGPYEVLTSAGFDVALVTHGTTDRVVASHGATIVPHHPLSDLAELVVVPGGGWTKRSPRGSWAEVQRGVLPAALAERHAAGTTIASVCTGAFLVAAAGLLDGRPAATHHDDFDDLDAMGVRVIRDARVVDDGDILSAGGVTSGIDLALWIVEREKGREAAAVVAADLEHRRDDRVWRREEAGNLR